MIVRHEIGVVARGAVQYFFHIGAQRYSLFMGVRLSLIVRVGFPVAHDLNLFITDYVGEMLGGPLSQRWPFVGDVGQQHGPVRRVIESKKVGTAYARSP